MSKLNKVILRIDGYTIKAVQFTEPTKEQMLAINKYLGAQAFQEKYLDIILEGYHDGDTFIPLFYKDGGSSWIELYDWLYVRNGEVYTAGTFNNLRYVIKEINESEVANG